MAIKPGSPEDAHHEMEDILYATTNRSYYRLLTVVVVTFLDSNKNFSNCLQLNSFPGLHEENG